LREAEEEQTEQMQLYRDWVQDLMGGGEVGLRLNRLWVALQAIVAVGQKQKEEHKQSASGLQPVLGKMLGLVPVTPGETE
jgi:hypothetical protein